jgi:hypothetical protein
MRMNKTDHLEQQDHVDPPETTQAPPGRATLTARLGARPIVLRVESAEAAREIAHAWGPRDANGVAAHADAALARTAPSSGAPLPDDVRARFETSTGADLSAVRVHTGEASASAAQAVGARAYTVGQDIHFGAGEYAPSDPFGLHLLAHEVAHTVQQQGGSPSMQCKLDVSTPGDDAEAEADRAADAMVAGSPVSIGGSSVAAARRISRARKFDWGVGGKVTPIADGLVKFQVEGSAKVEQECTFLTIAGQLSVGGVGEVKWKPDAHGGGISGKGGSGKNGKESQQYEVDVPVWQAEARKAAEAEAEKSWTDHFVPVDLDLVFGGEGSETPGNEAKEKPKQTKGGLTVGIKCKTRAGESFTVKAQLFELKKDGEVLDVSGPALKGGYEEKFKSNPIAVSAGEHPATLTVAGTIKPEITFKPNWAKIADEVARRGAKQIASDAITGAIDAAATAGPPLLAAAIIAHSIYIAGEKGQRDAAILEGARDARQAAQDVAGILCGTDYGGGTGPISREAQRRARDEIAQTAARNQVSVETLTAELRKQVTPVDYVHVENQTRFQGLAEYRRKVGETIAAWRKEHYIAALWTTQEDEVNAVWKMVEVIWEH